MATVTRTLYGYVDGVLRIEREDLRMAFMGDFIPEYYIFKDLHGDYITKHMDVIEVNFRLAVQEYSQL